jgi:Glycosyltransferase 61
MSLYMDLPKEERISFVKTYTNACLDNPTYPNCRIEGINPYDEQIMSMPTIGTESSTRLKGHDNVLTYRPGAYFFFIFNLTNYFHCLYDTLPYLIHYKELLKTHPDCKLLLPKDHTWMQFQTDMFDLLGITKFRLADDYDMYETLYVPSSLTHGKKANGQWLSNDPPSNDAWSIWQSMAKPIVIDTPKKIYISRRSWIHNDLSNIGTNYTTRRKCINEDEVVALAQHYGYQEVFCETMSMSEKIAMFQQATHILGFIGGGMANCLFSGPTTKVGCIETPEFLTINQRFQHTMNHTAVSYLPLSSLAPHTGPYALYVRVKVVDPASPYYGKIGEIETYTNGFYNVKLSNNDVAGFAHTASFPLKTFQPEELLPLDKGLNSPFQCDLRGLTEYLDKP